jgi:hypothetical protein
MRPDVWPKSFAPDQRPDPRSNKGNQLRDVPRPNRQIDPIDKSTKSASDAARLLAAMRWIDLP